MTLHSYLKNSPLEKIHNQKQIKEANNNLTLRKFQSMFKNYKNVILIIPALQTAFLVKSSIQLAMCDICILHKPQCNKCSLQQALVSDINDFYIMYSISQDTTTATTFRYTFYAYYRSCITQKIIYIRFMRHVRSLFV